MTVPTPSSTPPTPDEHLSPYRRFGVNIFACACNPGYRCQNTVIDANSSATPAAAGCELFVTGKLIPTASKQHFACVGRTSASCMVA